MNSRLDCEGSEGIEKEQSIRLPTSSFPPSTPVLAPLSPSYTSFTIYFYIYLYLDWKQGKREITLLLGVTLAVFFSSLSFFVFYSVSITLQRRRGTELYTLSFSLLLSLLVRDRRTVLFSPFFCLRLPLIVCTTLVLHQVSWRQYLLLSLTVLLQCCWIRHAVKDRHGSIRV